MTRQEIREDFRTENPEITDRVITDALLNSWMKKANKEICAIARCIVSNVSSTFTASTSAQYYDLESLISKFYDIDDSPGGGVYFNDIPITKSNPAEMNQNKRTWRSSSTNTPKKWWRRGKYLWFDVVPSAAEDVDIDSILLPDDFDADEKEPYNELGHLQVFSDGINKYLQWRCKQKVGKPEEAMTAQKSYYEYTTWMKKMVNSSKAAPIFLRPTSYPINRNV